MNNSIEEEAIERNSWRWWVHVADNAQCGLTKNGYRCGCNLEKLFHKFSNIWKSIYSVECASSDLQVNIKEPKKFKLHLETKFCPKISLTWEWYIRSWIISNRSLRLHLGRKAIQKSRLKLLLELLLLIKNNLFTKKYILQFFCHRLF